MSVFVIIVHQFLYKFFNLATVNVAVSKRKPKMLTTHAYKLIFFNFLFIAMRFVNYLLFENILFDEAH